MNRSFNDSDFGATAARINDAKAAADAAGSARSQGNADHKAAAYARFIPREELRSFAVWTPRAFTPASEAPINSGVSRPAPKKSAAHMQAEADRAAQPDQDAAALLRASRQAGYQDGYRDGLVALEAFKQSFMNQMMGQFGSLTGSFQSQLDEVEHQMSQALVRTATQIARQVVRSELSTRPELIVDVAQEALSVLLVSARHITLHVHPQDYAVVARGAAEGLAARGARLVADATLSRGGCLVSSDLGVVEANVETRWRRAAESIGCRDPYDAPQTAAELADPLTVPSAPASASSAQSLVEPVAAHIAVSVEAPASLAPSDPLESTDEVLS